MTVLEVETDQNQTKTGKKTNLLCTSSYLDDSNLT